MITEKSQDDALMAGDNILDKGVAQEKASNAPSNESVNLGTIDDLNLDTVHAESEYTEAEYKKLLWKIDLRLLALMWACSPHFTC